MATAGTVYSVSFEQNQQIETTGGVPVCIEGFLFPYLKHSIFLHQSRNGF
jgi:hypothetical protein